MPMRVETHADPDSIGVSIECFQKPLLRAQTRDLGKLSSADPPVLVEIGQKARVAQMILKLGATNQAILITIVIFSHRGRGLHG